MYTIFTNCNWRRIYECGEKAGDRAHWLRNIILVGNSTISTQLKCFGLVNSQPIFSQLLIAPNCCSKNQIPPVASQYDYAVYYMVFLISYCTGRNSLSSTHRPSLYIIITLSVINQFCVRVSLASGARVRVCVCLMFFGSRLFSWFECVLCFLMPCMITIWIISIWIRCRGGSVGNDGPTE